jgi:hypothetical protein
MGILIMMSSGEWTNLLLRGIFWERVGHLVILEEGVYNECIKAGGSDLVVKRSAGTLQKCFQGKSTLKLLLQ